MAEETSWVDEHGKIVFILPFFSMVYTDEETNRLNREFETWRCSPHPPASSFGKAEVESLVGRILGLFHLAACNPHVPVGVKKAELELVGQRACEDWYIQGLVEAGYLREKLIRGDLVVFPTEKMLETAQIPRRKH